MKKILIGIILCTFLLTSSMISAMGVGVVRSDVSDILIAHEEFIDYNDNTNISDVCFIIGPITSIYTEINLFNGSSSDISVINGMFNRIIPRLIFPFPIIYVENLTFKISFKREPLFDNTPFSYATSWGDIVNGAWDEYSLISNTIHTVSVTNFTGIFIRFRIKPLRLIPSIFSFIGQYDKILVVA